MVATAGGDSVGRGETLTHVHASELAFWNKSTAQDIWNGLIQAVPNTKGTAIFVESTANGVTGTFFELWKGAQAGENGFVPVFIPWFCDPDYREPVSKTFERTPDEEDLAEKYNLDDEQLMFRAGRLRKTVSIYSIRSILRTHLTLSSILGDQSLIQNNSRNVSMMRKT